MQRDLTSEEFARQLGCLMEESMRNCTELREIVSLSSHCRVFVPPVGIEVGRRFGVGCPVPRVTVSATNWKTANWETHWENLWPSSTSVNVFGDGPFDRRCLLTTSDPVHLRLLKVISILQQPTPPRVHLSLSKFVYTRYQHPPGMSVYPAPGMSVYPTAAEMDGEDDEDGEEDGEEEDDGSDDGDYDDEDHEPHEVDVPGVGMVPPMGNGSEWWWESKFSPQGTCESAGGEPAPEPIPWWQTDFPIGYAQRLMPLELETVGRRVHDLVLFMDDVHIADLVCGWLAREGGLPMLRALWLTVRFDNHGPGDDVVALCRMLNLLRTATPNLLDLTIDLERFSHHRYPADPPLSFAELPPTLQSITLSHHGGPLLTMGLADRILALPALSQFRIRYMWPEADEPLGVCLGRLLAGLCEADCSRDAGLTTSNLARARSAPTPPLHVDFMVRGLMPVLAAAGKQFLAQARGDLLAAAGRPFVAQTPFQFPPTRPLQLTVKTVGLSEEDVNALRWMSGLRALDLTIIHERDGRQERTLYGCWDSLVSLLVNPRCRSTTSLSSQDAYPSGSTASPSSTTFPHLTSLTLSECGDSWYNTMPGICAKLDRILGAYGPGLRVLSLRLHLDFTPVVIAAIGRASNLTHLTINIGGTNRSNAHIGGALFSMLAAIPTLQEFALKATVPRLEPANNYSHLTPDQFARCFALLEPLRDLRSFRFDCMAALHGERREYRSLEVMNPTNEPRMVDESLLELLSRMEAVRHGEAKDRAHWRLTRRQIEQHREQRVRAAAGRYVSLHPSPHPLPTACPLPIAYHLPVRALRRIEELTGAERYVPLLVTLNGPNTYSREIVDTSFGVQRLTVEDIRCVRNFMMV